MNNGNSKEGAGTGNKPYHARQLPTKKKLPEIRQTLASKYRLLHANPILRHEIGSKLSVDNLSVGGMSQSLKTMAQALDDGKPKRPATRTLAFSKPSEQKDRVSRAGTATKPRSTKVVPLTITSEGKRVDFIARNKQQAVNAKTKDAKFKKPAEPARVPVVPKKSTAKPEVKAAPIRRSLSAQHFDRQRKNASTQVRTSRTIKKTASFSEIQHNTMNHFQIEVSPIIEEQSRLTFKTPTAYERRSVAFRTPNSANNKSTSTLLKSDSFSLQNKLKDWLKRRGKSVGDFHHLKCFGVHSSNIEVQEENKENVETVTVASSSYEDLHANIPDREEKETVPDTNGTDGMDLTKVTKEALVDLYKLISEGYPTDDCEAWLCLIRQQYNNVKDDPQYWECRAALAQNRGNLNLAVECYKTAIIHGAEIQAVDESLDQLLQKFSLLNITTTAKKEERKERTRIVTDARNVFKSSIIQFAVQERDLKKNKPLNGTAVEKKKFIATPVRRSTRTSRSGYTSTPGITMYSTLLDVDNALRESIDFESNNAL